MRKKWQDEDDRPGWFWKFVRGVLVSILVCGFAIAGISLFVLPPAELPPEKPAEVAPAEPTVIGGIEVSQEPAYSSATAPAGEPAEEALAPLALDGPALSVNAAAFEADPQVPLIAVVLDDTAAQPLLRPLWQALTVPVTVGVIAGRDGDREVAEAARGAGFEVVAQLPLAPPGAAVGDDLEYGMPESEVTGRTEALMQRLPMAVGASRPMAAGRPPSGPVLTGIGAALAAHGFAYLDLGVELQDTAPGKIAGLPVEVAASRYEISADDDLVAAIAVLDAAASDAAIRGGAVVIAAPSETLFGALLLWGGEGTDNPARLAPLSAVIGRLSAQ
jgi:polysaccharide deacetylase 2 family uncharacterized protein YibQ